ncbi:MAG: hypothetical protein CL489_09000 [Acidobacteria bacterium]|nr:hypothetical protein [Acidobacteriota bacterium]|tara:strand:- start:31315 stop:32340 length:1026 start_codon:yes stop_codon:yes gene_type:complete
MSFKQFLFEKMTTSDAMKLLGLSNGFDETELKKAYRRASNKAHPDKGGSVDAQQRVNDAYNVLKNVEGGVDPMAKYRQRAEENKEKARIAEIYVEQLFNQYFQPRVYANYFKEMSGKEYTFERNIRSSSTWGSVVHVSYRFTSDDNKTFFDIDFYANMYFTKALGGGEESTGLDSLSVNTSVLHERKKYKMSRSDYKRENSIEVIQNPDKNFPKAKLKKVFSVKKRKPVKRADYLLAFSKELNATKNKDYIKIPLKNGYVLVFTRIVFMRQAQYQGNGLYTEKPFRREKLIITSFMESKNPDYLDDLIDGMKKIQNTSTPETIEKDLEVLKTKLERRYMDD